MKYSFYRAIGVLLYCITCIVIVKAEEGVIKDAEFVIEKERKNQLSIEDKLLEKAPVTTYIPDSISTIPQASIKEEVPHFPTIPYQGDHLYGKILLDERVHRNYIKIGSSVFPNPKSMSIKPYGMLFLSSNPHPKHNYRMQFFYTPMRNIDYAVPLVLKIYNKLFTTYCILKGNLSYQYDTYLIDNKNRTKQSQKETLHHVQASIMCTDYEKNAIRYRTAIHYHFLNYGYKKLNEHVCNGYLNIKCTLQDWITFQTKSNFYITRYQSSETIQYRNLACINPALIGVLPHLHLKIGGWLAYQNNDSQKIPNNNFYKNPIHLGPKVKIEGVFNNVNLYAGLNGTIQPILLHNIGNENVFLTENTELKHHKCWQIDGGIKITLFTHLIAHAGVSNEWKYDAYRFLRTRDKQIAFKVTYCDSAAKIVTTNFFGALNYTNSANFINIYLRGDYYAQSKKNIPTWWYNDPRYKISAQSVFKLFKKILLKSTFYFLEGIKLKDRFGKTEKLKNILDLGIGIDYLWSSKFTIFLNADNVLDRENKCYVDYPAKKFYLIGGLMYSW